MYASMERLRTTALEDAAQCPRTLEGELYFKTSRNIIVQVWLIQIIFEVQ